MIKKRRRTQYGFLTLFFSLTVFCMSSFPVASKSYRVLSNIIEKSDNDPRQYQFIELPNQMRVLLVSDPSAIKSLGAIVVPVGSFHDPVDQQGLAHYTEHMVLMGSRHYPEPDGFSEFLSKHAGRYNASTSKNRTAYYFEVENGALNEAANRLADAIALPLLNKNYADKERNAVHQEATLAQSNDAFRIQQIDAETVNQSHPAALFSVGNLETLSDKPSGTLHDALLAFYDRYYSSNLMTGILYGRGSLADLAGMAEQSFGRIKNNNKKIEPIEVKALTQTELGKMIYVEPAQPKRLLYLQFPIDNNIANFKNKSDVYIGYLLTNHSEGTLTDILIKKGLIDGISTSYDPTQYGNSGVFTIVVNLTEQGLKEKDKIIGAIFNYIHLIKQKGIDKKYYREMSQVLNLEFKYQNVIRDMEYIEWLADQTLLYPVQHILNAEYITGGFNPTEISHKLTALNPDNARIWVIAPKHHYDKQAYFMNAPYRIISLDSSQKAAWTRRSNESGAVLPELNPFIETQFSVIKQTTNVKQSYQFDPHGNMMYFPSERFANEPKGALILSLRQNHLMDTAKQQVAFPMLDYLVSRAMTKLTFQASVAGMNLSHYQDNGLMLVATGYSQYLPRMLNAMISQYQNLNISKSDLTLARSWYLQQLDASNEVRSYALAMQPITALDTIPYIERDKRRILAEQVTVNDLLQFRDRLLGSAVPYLLAIGNLDKNTITSLFTAIKSSRSHALTFMPPKKLSINNAKNALFQQKAHHNDNALALVYLPQNSSMSRNDEAKSRLLTKIISPWFYTQLRSEEQLAYALFTFPIILGKSHGFGFLLQSNHYDPAYIYQRYQALFPTVLTKLSTLSDAEFWEYKQGLLAEMQEAPHTFDEEVETYLDDFVRSNFAFDSHKKLVRSLQSLTKDDLIEFYRKLVLEDKGFSILSQVMGSKQKENIMIPKGYHYYENASQLQQKLLTGNK